MAQFFKIQPGLIEIVTLAINEIMPDGSMKLVSNVADQKPKVIGYLRDTPLRGEQLGTYINATAQETATTMQGEEMVLLPKSELERLRADHREALDFMQRLSDDFMQPQYFNDDSGGMYGIHCRIELKDFLGQE